MTHVENIVAIFKLSTPQEIANGVKWYADAQAEALTIAKDFELPLHVVVGVMAALSPNNKWERNVTNTRDLVGAYMNGEDIDSVKVSTYHTMKRKAWTILEAMPSHEDVLMILNGQKIQSFYSNIMGEDTCTVDGHAYNIAHGVRLGLTSGQITIGKKLYRELQQAYVEAGAMVRVNGRKLKAFEIQAITWVTWKRIHNI